MSLKFHFESCEAVKCLVCVFRLSVHASVNVYFVARQVWAAAMVTTAADTVSISFYVDLFLLHFQQERNTQITQCLYCAARS